MRALLLRPTTRLVTLTGAGGVGKTRLAIQVASDLDAGFDSIAFVPLASVRDPDLVPVTIARAVGLHSPDEPTADALHAYLRPRRMLLILDNVEHLLDAGPALVDLLVGAAGLTVLVTSRALLRISGEHVVTVAAAEASRSGNAAVRWRARSVQCGAVVRRALQGGSPLLRRRRPERGGRGGDMSPTRWVAAGDRAGVGSNHGPCRRMPCSGASSVASRC